MVRIAPRARRDLTACLAHIARDNPAAAVRLADRVLSLIGELADGGFDGPEQQLLGGQRVRSWPVPPLRVYCRRPKPDTLEILRIYHQARRPIVR